MSAKENPAPEGKGFSQSSFAATSKDSQTTSARSSGKSNRQKRREPRPGTQRRIILDLLRSRPGDWVGVHEMMRAANPAASYTVICELRQRYGFKIKNRMRRSKQGQTLSDYQLEEEPK